MCSVYVYVCVCEGWVFEIKKQKLGALKASLCLPSEKYVKYLFAVAGGQLI